MCNYVQRVPTAPNPPSPSKQFCLFICVMYIYLDGGGRRNNNNNMIIIRARECEPENKK